MDFHVESKASQNAICLTLSLTKMMTSAQGMTTVDHHGPTLVLKMV
jgi:hypothetical protein